ncbi:MAG: hypothetical protein ACPLRY_01165 [Candidatus Bathyarchaeales archaeon]
MDEKDKKVYSCLICGRKISREEYETYDGLCQECYELEIAELDFEDE